MSENRVHLSERLQCLADMVPEGKRVVDVGCDHGFVSIYLVQSGISPHVLAMDVREGPLSRAKEHIQTYGLEQYIETRISDGLKAFTPGEAEVCICAGMGGRLMMSILRDSEEKAKQLDALILQPQSELPVFRQFLRKEGYIVTDENILLEDGKYYFVMQVISGVYSRVASEQTLDTEEERFYDNFSRILLEKRHPVMRRYLTEQRESVDKLMKHLKDEDGERAASRLSELSSERMSIDKALNLMDKY
ncbi:MAG: class I SAM-dependent methyltransferase [Acetatifactor sp.]|nr:class I SAM-dependent methyltransferase [Acetatifactor sp.]